MPVAVAVVGLDSLRAPGLVADAAVAVAADTYYAADPYLHISQLRLACHPYCRKS